MRDDESVRLRAPLRCWHESLVSARTDALISLSREGGFIATGRPVPPGTPLFLEISLDGSRDGALENKAEIDAVAVAAATSEDEGFEVRFVGLDERARDLLERVLAEERPAPTREDARVALEEPSEVMAPPQALEIALDAAPPHVEEPLEEAAEMMAPPEALEALEDEPEALEPALEMEPRTDVIARSGAMAPIDASAAIAPVVSRPKDEAPTARTEVIAQPIDEEPEPLVARTEVIAQPIDEPEPPVARTEVIAQPLDEELEPEPPVAGTELIAQPIAKEPEPPVVAKPALVIAKPMAPGAATKPNAGADVDVADLEVTDRMERPVNIPAPALASVDETQPLYAAPRPDGTLPASFELPRTITVDEPPPGSPWATPSTPSPLSPWSPPTPPVSPWSPSTPSASSSPAPSAPSAPSAPLPPLPPSAPASSTLPFSPRSPLASSPSSSPPSLLSPLPPSPFSPSPFSASPLPPSASSPSPLPRSPAPPSPAARSPAPLASSPSAPSWLVEATSDGGSSDTRPWAPVPPPNKPLPAWPTSSLSVPEDDETRPWVRASRTESTSQPPFEPSSPSVPLPKIASLDMTGPPLPATEETMRWPTARLRVAEAPIELPSARPPVLDPQPRLLPVDTSAPAAEQEVEMDLTDAADDDDDGHPAPSPFGAGGQMLGDPDEIPVGGFGADLGDVEVTDPGLGRTMTAPALTTEDVPLASLAGRPADVVTLEEDRVEEMSVDVVDVGDLAEYRDVLGVRTAPPATVAPDTLVTALMPRVLAQELQRQALPSLDDQLPDLRPGSTQPYLTLKGADVGSLDARLPIGGVRPAFEAPAELTPAGDFDPFAPTPTVVTPRSSTDVLVPGAFDAMPRSDPALPVELPPVPRRATTDVIMPPAGPAAPTMPAWSEAATSPPFEPSMPVAIPVAASPVSALLGNQTEGEVLSLDTPVEGQIESFFDDLAFQALEPQRKEAPAPASSWQLMEERAPPAPAPVQAQDEEDIPLVVGEDLPAAREGARASDALPRPLASVAGASTGRAASDETARKPTTDPFNGLDWIVGEPAKK